MTVFFWYVTVASPLTCGFGHILWTEAMPSQPRTMMRHYWNAAIASRSWISTIKSQDWPARGQGSRGVEAETRQDEADQKKKRAKDRRSQSMMVGNSPAPAQGTSCWWIPYTARECRCGMSSIMYLHVSMYAPIYNETKNPWSRLSLPLPLLRSWCWGFCDFLLTLTKLNLFLPCSNDRDLFIEHSFLCICLCWFFSSSWFDLLSFAKRVQTYTQPVWYRRKGGRKRHTQRGQTVNGRWEEPLGSQVQRCSNRYDISFSFLFVNPLFIPHHSLLSRYGLILDYDGSSDDQHQEMQWYFYIADP